MEKKKLKIDKDLCAGCMACATVCTYNALILDDDNKATIDQKKCSRCEKCVQVCPFGAIIEVEENE